VTGCAGTGTGWFIDDVTVTTCPAATPLGFYTITPCRVFDTRAGAPLTAGARRFQVTGQCGVPVGARAVSANLTIVSPQAQGYVTVYPGDAPLPATSTLNFSPGQVRANSAMLSLAGDGTGTIQVYSAITGTADLVLDVNGYFQ
jgi:hypothetical protein